MATFHGQTVDIHEDFEDALDGSWVETDTGSLLDPNDAAAEYAGTYGMSVDLNSATAAWVAYTFATPHDNYSLGWWFNTAALSPYFGGVPIFYAYADGGSVLRIYQERDAGDNTKRFQIRGSGDAIDGPTCVDDTWYWLTVDVVRNGTSTLRVYDTAGDQVGIDVTVDTVDYATQYLWYGNRDGGTSVASSWYFDDAVMDWTAQTFPLLGWSAGPGDGIAILRRRRM